MTPKLGKMVKNSLPQIFNSLSLKEKDRVFLTKREIGHTFY
jgi:hypothetical protein